MNHYKTSMGERISKVEINRRIRLAKKQKLQDQLNEYGYNFCEYNANRHDLRLTCAHIISVKKCQEMAMSELAWDIKNIKIFCMLCHQKYDNNDIRLK